MRNDDATSRLTQRTIEDFGDQWKRYTDNDGYYGSADVLADTLGPLLPLSAFEGKRIAEIGSGTGRIVRMLLSAGAAHVLAIEPSEAVEVLRENSRSDAERVEILNVRGEEIPAGSDLDFIISIGVVHHIPDPAPVMSAAHRALKPGGRIIIWVYGVEGNRFTVTVIQAMRRLTTRLPHAALGTLAWVCNGVLAAYLPVTRLFPRLPLSDYLQNVFGKFSRDKRYLVIYDQLRPAYAKYYTQEAVRALLENAGFTDLRLFHRRGYSWTALGRRS